MHKPEVFEEFDALLPEGEVTQFTASLETAKTEAWAHNPILAAEKESRAKELAVEYANTHDVSRGDLMEWAQSEWADQFIWIAMAPGLVWDHGGVEPSLEPEAALKGVSHECTPGGERGDGCQ